MEQVGVEQLELESICKENEAELATLGEQRGQGSPGPDTKAKNQGQRPQNAKLYRNQNAKQTKRQEWFCDKLADLNRHTHRHEEQTQKQAPKRLYFSDDFMTKGRVGN